MREYYFFSIGPKELKERFPEISHLADETVFFLVQAFYNLVVGGIVFDNKIVRSVKIDKKSIVEPTLSSLIYDLETSSGLVEMELKFANISKGRRLYFVIKEVVLKSQNKKALKKIAFKFQFLLEKMELKKLTEKVKRPFYGMDIDFYGFSQEIIEFYGLEKISLRKKVALPDTFS